MARRVFFVALLLGSAAFAAASASWSVTSTGSLATPMESATAILLNNGNVVMFGDATGSAPGLGFFAHWHGAPLARLAGYRGHCAQLLGDAREAFRRWRDFVSDAPDEISSIAFFWTIPRADPFPHERRCPRTNASDTRWFERRSAHR